MKTKSKRPPSGTNHKSQIQIIAAKYGLLGTIITAICTLIGSLLVAIFGFWGSYSQTQFPINATMTAEAKILFSVTPTLLLLPTATPISSPTLISTNIQQNYPTSISENWKTIFDATTIWSPYFGVMTPRMLSDNINPKDDSTTTLEQINNAYKDGSFNGWNYSPGIDENYEIPLSITIRDKDPKNWVKVSTTDQVRINVVSKNVPDIKNGHGSN